jgi:cyanophycin synthetase
MLRMQLNLGLWESRPTSRLPGFGNALVEAVPALAEHGCSYDRPGGFIKRMQEGTWLGHVIEHVALELQNEAGFKVTRGKTRTVNGRSGIYNVMFEYGDEDVAACAGLQLFDVPHAWWIICVR